MTRPLFPSQPAPPVNDPGRWRQIAHRLRRDRWASIAMAVVGGYLLLVLLTASGLLASNWSDEVALSYAPPTLLATAPADDPAEDQISQQGTAHSPASDLASARPLLTPNPRDPLSSIIQRLNRDLALDDRSKFDEYGLVDPLGTDMAELSGKRSASARPARRASLPFGADLWGHDVLLKAVKGTQISLVVGLSAAVVATLIGSILGALGGFFGGWVDALLEWVYNVLSAIPYLLLILTVAAVLQQRGVWVIVIILGVTGWTGVYRLMRAEYLRHRQRDYVRAARAIGVSPLRCITVHIFPNVAHIALVQMSLLTIGFIKSEVILSFLGFGVPVGSVSWGSMLAEAPNELLLGNWWQLATVTVLMAVLVMAFSVLTDAMRDALDPHQDA